MNKKVSDALFIFLLLAVICFMIFVIMFIMRWKDAFAENPMVFGARKLGNVNCECTKETSTGILLHFRFNDNEWIGSTEKNVLYKPTTFENINLTLWEELNG